jgi:hypothetical protein
MPKPARRGIFHLEKPLGDRRFHAVPLLNHGSFPRPARVVRRPVLVLS